MLENGWPLHNIQKMLGHAHLSQTSTYLNATEQGLRHSMRRFGTEPFQISPTATIRLFATSPPRTTVN